MDAWNGTWMKYERVFKFLERHCTSNKISKAHKSPRDYLKPRQRDSFVI